ncbi:MAG: hypothetical protein ACYC4H_06115 [Desulfocucumaceae bacterium]
MAANIDRLVEEIKALTPEQKNELARKLDEEAVFNGQRWYWTPEWQVAEKEADKDIAAGRVHHFDKVDDAIKFLHHQRHRPSGAE